jgi:hypothetical protein
MATKNRKTSPSSQAPIADMRAADTAANKSDALDVVWYFDSEFRPYRVTVKRSPRINDIGMAHQFVRFCRDLLSLFLLCPEPNTMWPS